MPVLFSGMMPDWSATACIESVTDRCHPAGMLRNS